MSNQQWNNGQGSNEWAKPSSAESAQEWAKPSSAQSAQQPPAGTSWGQPPASGTSAQEWSQPAQGSSQSAQDWAAQGSGQPAQEPPAGTSWGQPPASGTSAQEWGSAPSQSWGQPQQPAQDWGQTQQPAQDWGQTQQPAQEWGQTQAGQQWGQQPQQTWEQSQQPTGQGWDQAQQPQQAGQQWSQQGWGQGQGPQVQPATPVEPKPSPFDLSVRKLSLPDAAGLIFMLGAIALVVEWLFGFIAILASGNDFIAPSGWAILQSLIGGLAGVLFKLLVLRVLVEIGVAATRMLARDGKVKDTNDEEPPAA